MRADTGEIYRFKEMEEFFEKQKEVGKPLIPLSPELADELEPMGARQRKNNMRNKPCVCGSGKKFKRCCWHRYA